MNVHKNKEVKLGLLMCIVAKKHSIINYMTHWKSIYSFVFTTVNEYQKYTRVLEKD